MDTSSGRLIKYSWLWDSNMLRITNQRGDWVVIPLGLQSEQQRGRVWSRDCRFALGQSATDQTSEGYKWLVLVVIQVLGDFTARSNRMEAYLELVNSLQVEFDSCLFEQVPCEWNKQSDAFATLGSAIENEFMWKIPVRYLDKSCIDDQWLKC